MLLIAAIVFFLFRSGSRQSKKDRETPADSPGNGGRRSDHKPVTPSSPPQRPIPAAVVRVREDEPPRVSSPPSAQQPLTAPTAGLFHVAYLLGTNGRPIGSDDRDAWLLARRHGVTATDVKKIVKLNGVASKQRPALLNQKLTGEEGPRLAAFQHGIDREPVIAAWVAQEFGIVHNSYVCAGSNSRHLATPDGIGQDIVAEIKTSVKPLSATMGMYRDQLQWQLHVTHSTRVLFVVENRHTLQREVQWVHRDEQRIKVLEKHADFFIAELDALLAGSSNAITAGNLVGYPIALLHQGQGVTQPRIPEEPESPRPVSAPDTVSTVEILSVRDEDEERRWTPFETSRLLFLYDEGASLAEMASNFSVSNRAVVFELTRGVLNAEGKLVDTSAGKFGSAWSSDEILILTQAYFDGIWLPSLAHKLARDQLGIAFKLFEHRLPSATNRLDALSWLDRPDVTSDDTGVSFDRQIP